MLHPPSGGGKQNAKLHFFHYWSLCARFLTEQKSQGLTLPKQVGWGCWWGVPSPVRGELNPVLILVFYSPPQGLRLTCAQQGSDAGGLGLHYIP